MLETSMPVAQYLRMSTEHQNYSIENQAEAISEFAASSHLSIVKTYADPGRSGLTLEKRPGLKQLISDVLGGKVAFRAILVYDVSRWGRFSNPDEAAHYEFLCKSNGIPVLYCTEMFSNQLNLPNTIMKAVKRTMAAEYIRELSLRIKYGKAHAAAEGLRTGGEALYGFKRLLLDYDGRPKRFLERGERRCLGTGKVVDARGSEEECKVVQRIFREFVEEVRNYREIAERLNSDGTPYVGGRKWCTYSVRRVLTQRKYTGTQRYRKMSCLDLAHSDNSPEEWGEVKLNFKPIISDKMFRRAQDRFKKYAPRPKHTNDELLDNLRIILRDHGCISSRLIRETGFNYSSYKSRFGSLSSALALIGARPETLIAHRSQVQSLITV